jgi:hypothetical protein
MAPPSAATSQVVRHWVSISIGGLRDNSSLFPTDYIAACLAVQPI